MGRKKRHCCGIPGRLCLTQQQWLQLLPGQGGVQGLRDPGEVRHHGGGLVFGIVLAEGYKIVVLPAQKLADVFGTG